jgi:hypothetical protein
MLLIRIHELQNQNYSVSTVYLFTNENRGPFLRIQLIIIPGAGRPSSDTRKAFFRRCRDGLPPGSEGQSSRPVWPSSSSRTDHLGGQGYLHVNGYSRVITLSDKYYKMSKSSPTLSERIMAMRYHTWDSHGFFTPGPIAKIMTIN